jgi:hypothetical protein
MHGIMQSLEQQSKPLARSKSFSLESPPTFVSTPHNPIHLSRYVLTLSGTSFLALSLVEAGYEVFANTDASGTFTDKLAFDANRRMEKAGVTLMGMFAIAMDLMRDWSVHCIPVFVNEVGADVLIGVTPLVLLRFSHFWTS